MVLDALIAILTGLIKAAMDLLPDWNIGWAAPLNVDNTFYGYDFNGQSWGSNTPIVNIIKILKSVNDYIPMDHLIAILSMAVTFWSVMWAWRAIKLLVGWVRGAGT